MQAEELRGLQAPLKERYCVVYQTLRQPPESLVSHTAAPSRPAPAP